MFTFPHAALTGVKYYYSLGLRSIPKKSSEEKRGKDLETSPVTRRGKQVDNSD